MPKADEFGFIPGKDKWPNYVEEQIYVRDRIGVIWLLCPEYNGSIATTATADGPFSVSINTLRDLRGPLHILKLTGEVLDNFSTIQPVKKLNEPINGTLAPPFGSRSQS